MALVVFSLSSSPRLLVLGLFPRRAQKKKLRYSGSSAQTTFIINYRGTPNSEFVAKELTGGSGVDLVVEVL